MCIGDTMKMTMDCIEERGLPNFNGGEGVFFARMQIDELGKILKGRLPKGASIGEHVHATSSETIFILSGEGTAVCDGAEEKLRAGDCHYCPKGSKHTLRNEGEEDLIFYAVVPNQ